MMPEMAPKWAETLPAIGVQEKSGAVIFGRFDEACVTSTSLVVYTAIWSGREALYAVICLVGTGNIAVEASIRKKDAFAAHAGGICPRGSGAHGHCITWLCRQPGLCLGFYLHLCRR